MEGGREGEREKKRKGEREGGGKKTYHPHMHAEQDLSEVISGSC